MLNIKQRQLALKTYRYFYTKSIDGIEGSGTKKAYKNFQKHMKIKANGIYDEGTNAKLVACIKDIQTKLNTRGNYGLVVDGIVGSATINAIKNFQYLNRLVMDGICGNKTFKALETKKLSWSDIKYFKKSELTCKCGCGLNNVELELVIILDDIRAHFGKPMFISSGCRCKKHNKAVGGVSNSRHVSGKGADIYIPGISTSKILEYTKSLVKAGKLRYTYTNGTNMNGVVHVDIK